MRFLTKPFTILYFTILYNTLNIVSGNIACLYGSVKIVTFVKMLL